MGFYAVKVKKYTLIRPLPNPNKEKFSCIWNYDKTSLSFLALHIFYTFDIIRVIFCNLLIFLFIKLYKNVVYLLDDFNFVLNLIPSRNGYYCKNGIENLRMWTIIWPRSIFKLLNWIRVYYSKGRKIKENEDWSGAEWLLEWDHRRSSFTNFDIL